MTTVVGVLLGIAVVLFVRSAWSGVGPAHRVVQYAYCRIGSLARYQKSDRRYASLEEIMESSGEPWLEAAARRVMPSLSGWFMPFPTDKGGFHDYLPLYRSLLEPYRDRKGACLLEVGVHKGGSLALWREYFAESARVFGIDVNRGVQSFPLDGGIKVLILDSRDAAVVARALRGLTFDVIIDDGLHHPEAQRRTFEALRPFLKPEGVYVVEDVYSLRPDHFLSHGDEVVVYPDRSGQSLVVVRPPACEAGRPVGHVAEL